MTLRKALIAALLLLAPNTAMAQSFDPHIAGDLENFFLGKFDNGPSTLKYQIRWLSLHGDVNPSLRIVATEVEFTGRDQLDETYALVHNDKVSARIGRIRPAFGIFDWSDNYYSGFTRLPLLRVTRFGATPALVSFSDGFDVQWGSGASQFTVGLVDNTPESWQILPYHPNRLVARGQWFTDNIIFGANVLASVDRNDSYATRLLDFDGRWSVPHVEIRGELLTGTTGGYHPFGYYTELFIRPAFLMRTTFLFRTEAVLGPLPASAYSSAVYGDDAEYLPHQTLNQAQTIGLKQILNRFLVLQLSYGLATHGPSASSLKGYGVELVVHTYL